jgi:hypothetical protein
VIAGVYGSKAAAHSSSQSPPATPPSTLTITILSADTKQLWMADMASEFNAAGYMLSDGSRAAVAVVNNGSVLQPELRPTIWSPQFSNFIPLQQYTHGLALISDLTTNCLP